MEQNTKTDQEKSGIVFSELEVLLRLKIQSFLQELLNEEAEAFLGLIRYKRKGGIDITSGYSAIARHGLSVYENMDDNCKKLVAMIEKAMHATAVQGNTTAVPGCCSAITGNSIAVPGNTTAVPGSGNAVTGSSTTMPGSGNAVTGSSTTMPGGGNAVTGSSTTMPGGGNAVTGSSTTMPGGGNAVPGSATAVPGGCNAVTGIAIAVPGGNAVPGGGNAVPDSSTAVPGSGNGGLRELLELSGFIADGKPAFTYSKHF